MFFYKETAFGFGCSFWLHQRGIPRRTWRLYCSLRGHQRVGTAGFANPSFPTLWTPPFPTLGDRCGGLIRLPRVYRDIGFRCPVLSLIATSIFCLGALCSILYRSRFSRSCLACIVCFSLLGGKKRCLCSFFARFLITADRDYCFNFVGCKSISPIAPGAKVS